MAAKPNSFLSKLYQMANCDEPSHRECVEWEGDGSYFWVTNAELFARNILPRYFKHNNYASFVRQVCHAFGFVLGFESLVSYFCSSPPAHRQLNMYGFTRSTTAHKDREVRPGAMMVERFSHPKFLRGRADLLPEIRRKVPSHSKKSKSDSDDVDAGDREAHIAVVAVESRTASLEKQLETLSIQNQQMAVQLAVQGELLKHITSVLAQNGVSDPKLLAMLAAPDQDLPMTTANAQVRHASAVNPMSGTCPCWALTTSPLSRRRQPRAHRRPQQWVRAPISRRAPYPWHPFQTMPPRHTLPSLMCRACLQTLR